MRTAAALIGLVLSAPAYAETFACVLDDDRQLRFRVDPNLFVDAVSPEEPIRRKVTTIQLDDTRFPAEPFAIGALRGFSAESLGAGTLMFVVRPDGRGILTDQRAGLRQEATCEVTQ